MSYSISHSILQTFLLLISITFTSFVTLQKEVKFSSPFFFSSIRQTFYFTTIHPYDSVTDVSDGCVTMLIPSHFSQIQTGLPHGCIFFQYNNLLRIEHFFSLHINLRTLFTLFIYGSFKDAVSKLQYSKASITFEDQTLSQVCLGRFWDGWNGNGSNVSAITFILPC